MAILKQAYYEGAALYSLVRAEGGAHIEFERPFYVLDRRRWLFVKYCTKGRSPWGFTFSADEQALMKRTAARRAIVIGLVCGADGIATLSYDAYLTIAVPRQYAIHIGCSRQHYEQYEISGPDGTLDGKVPPSSWQNIL